MHVSAVPARPVDNPLAYAQSIADCHGHAQLLRLRCWEKQVARSDKSMMQSKHDGMAASAGINPTAGGLNRL